MLAQTSIWRLKFVICHFICYNTPIRVWLKYAGSFGGSLLKSAAFWGAFLFVAASVTFSAFGAGFGEEAPSALLNSGGPTANPQASFVTAGTGEASPNEKAVLSTVFISDSAVMGDTSPLTGIVPLGNGMMKYKVKRGDTLSSVAGQFQTTVAEIKLANQSIKSLAPGSWVVIPSAVASDTLSVATGSLNLPNLKGYFGLPAVGWNWGTLHSYNAVDIANPCGTPVSAAADGLVVSDPNLGDGSSGWNDGYGIFVLLEHPNGTKTRYAHLAKALVKVGDVVVKGQEIGLMGNTGNAQGPTGCHLHFEVYGAKNPFAIN